MRTTPLSILALIVFTACTSQGAVSIEQQNENPLSAARYGEELADTMANIIIQEDPIASDPDMRRKIEEGIAKGKSIAAVAQQRQREGSQGVFIPMKFDSKGICLLLGNTLYMSSDFWVQPGPQLHVYLTEAVDPRDIEFPDPTAVDLGRLRTNYGAHSYSVPGSTDKLRTAVIWDTSLNRLAAFAQLSRR